MIILFHLIPKQIIINKKLDKNNIIKNESR